MESWEPPTSRHRMVRAALVGVLVVVGVVIARGLAEVTGGADLEVERDADPPPGSSEQDEPTVPPGPEPAGHWRPLPEAPIPGRHDHVAVWTGDGLLVWGGRDSRGWRVDGALYDPVTAAWEEVPDAPHVPYAGTRAVWDGTRLVVTGFRDHGHAAYDPGSGAWQELAAPPLADRWGATGTLAGSAVLGGDSGGEATAVAYDDDGARWAALPSPPLAGTSELTEAHEGLAALGPREGAGLGVTVYDPGAGEWSAPVDVPEGAEASPLMVADAARSRLVLAGRARGTEAAHPILAWRIGGGDEGWAPLPALAGDIWRAAPRLIPVGDGLVAWPVDDPGAAAWLPAEGDAWQPLSLAPEAAAPGGEAVWTGDELLVWGGAEASGAAWRPRPGRPVELPPADAPRLEGSWRELPAPPTPREQPAVVWTGRELVVWGGHEPGGGVGLDDGARYDPEADAWRPVAASRLPGRAGAVTAFLDGEVLLWGGASADGWRSDGGAYDPDADAWRHLPDAPVEAGPAVGAVVGGELWVVAGTQPRVAAYDPAEDAWRDVVDPPERAGAPLGLAGSEEGAMLITERTSWLLGPDEHAWWQEGRHTIRERALVAASDEHVVALGGGEVARYDPARGHWSRPAEEAWAAAGDGPSAWTGTHLLAWGAVAVGDLAGGREGAAAYQPDQDQWSVLPDPPAGVAPDGPAVWTGEEVVLWSSQGPPLAFRPR